MHWDLFCETSGAICDEDLKHSALAVADLMPAVKPFLLEYLRGSASRSDRSGYR